MRVQLLLSHLWERVEMDGYEYMLALAPNNRFYLLSNDPDLDGDPNSIRHEHGFSYSWVDECRNDSAATFELSNMGDVKAAELRRLINHEEITEIIDFYLPGVDGDRIYRVLSLIILIGVKTIQ